MFNRLFYYFTQAEKIHQLGENLGETMANAEKLGADGHVEESLKMMEMVENLRKEKTEAEVCNSSVKLFHPYRPL